MSVTVGFWPEILTVTRAKNANIRAEWLVLVSIHPDGTPGVGVRIDAEPGQLLPPQAVHWAVGHVRTDTKSKSIVAVVDADVPPERAESIRGQISDEAARFGMRLQPSQLSGR
ncbi:hypothetical protein [Sinomonas humi]|uniref:Uncharacterized protein n=1 Tax=Sinomonas humi TaxID=1338436 RepID=A0A0B2AT68_9MICC|nr:hypothetical protein [Sinomonas humi]KHL05034.1 hypothetical protein LK10_03540 [Sinomonas humi]